MTGTYEHTIDGKGRLIIPSRLKEELGETFHLSLGTDRFLSIYPEEKWADLCRRAEELEDDEDVMRMEVFFANSFACTVDSQSRIVIPQKLRESAGLDREVVIVGANNVVRIWDAAVWNERMASYMTPDSMKNLARKMRL